MLPLYWHGKIMLTKIIQRPPQQMPGYRKVLFGELENSLQMIFLYFNREKYVIIILY